MLGIHAPEAGQRDATFGQCAQGQFESITEDGGTSVARSGSLLATPWSAGVMVGQGGRKERGTRAASAILGLAT